MAAMSDYLENELRDWLKKIAFAAPPANFYLALFTTATTDAGGGAEVVGGSYARQVVAFGDGASAGEATSTGGVTFAAMPACTATHGAITDALTGGNFVLHGPLASPLVIANGETVTFSAANIDATFL